jgi:hypothetical protein
MNGLKGDALSPFIFHFALQYACIMIEIDPVVWSQLHAARLNETSEV